MNDRLFRQIEIDEEATDLFDRIANSKSISEMVKLAGISTSEFESFLTDTCLEHESEEEALAISEIKECTLTAGRKGVSFDESRVIACYANFCRVTGTPEELIVDFGLNNQPMGVPTESIPITQRIIVNFFTAKRLLGALSMSIQRHEQAFGVLDTDVQRRAQRQRANVRPDGSIATV